MITQTGSHHLYAADGSEMPDPVVYLDAFIGWVRDDYANGVVREAVVR